MGLIIAYKLKGCPMEADTPLKLWRGAMWRSSSEQREP